MMEIELEVFAVMNKDGQFFRSKGYGGWGSNWVDDINRAKIYPKIGSARQRVSYFANHHPEFGIPKIVKMKVTSVEIIDDSERVAKAQKDAEEKQLEYQKKRIKQKEIALRRERDKIDRQLKGLGGS